MANDVWRLQLRSFSAYETFPASIWADVARILHRLDGVRHDDAILEYLADGVVVTWLNLGGGADERVVAGLQLADVDYVLHLVDPPQGEALATQSVGGQETPLPGKFYVPLDRAVQAARYFYRHRAADPKATWEAPGFDSPWIKP